jgi:hypothetical protein
MAVCLDRWLGALCLIVPMVGGLMSAPGHELLLFQERQTPSTFGTLSVNVLLAHSVPDNVIIGQAAPTSTDLSSFA